MQRKLKQISALALASGAGVLGLTGAARAELVFYEGFNYAVGDLHNNVNTSVEPDDAWTRSGLVAAASIDISTGSLTSPVGASAGGKVTITNPATASTERLNFPAISTGTVWYSFSLNASVGSATVNQLAGAYFGGLTSLDYNGGADGGAPPSDPTIGVRMALRRDSADG